MEASPANDRATVEPLLETIAMELNGGTVPDDDLPAADANMQDRREDPDLSASALQTGVAGPKQHESASPGPGTCYPHGGRYDCHGYHGFRQSGTDRVYATDSMPSCDICLCASVGRGVQSRL